MEDSDKIGVAVLCPLGRDRHFVETMPGGDKYTFHFLNSALAYSSRDLAGAFDMRAYVEECVGYIRSRPSISVLLGTRDVADIVAAAVAAVLNGEAGGGRFLAPSVDSAFLCLHKIRTRQELDPTGVFFEAVPVQDLPERVDLLPIFVKPTAASCSQAAFYLENKSGLARAAVSLQKELPVLSGYLMDFLRKHLSRSEVELAEKLNPSTIALAEEYIDAPYIVAVDGLVDKDGGAHPWIISDCNYHKAAELCFSDVTAPSRIYKEVPGAVARLEEAYLEVGRRLAARGFRAQFLDVEFFVRPDSTIKLMEVNGRMDAQMTQVFREVLGVDTYKALIQTCLGRDPPRPAKYSPGMRVGSNVYINVILANPADADDLLDFDAVEEARKEGGVTLEVKVAPGERLETGGNAGVCLALISLSSTSREENLSRSLELQRRILREPELAPWHPDFRSVKNKD